MTVTIEDKDGGSQSWTWYFTVAASKTLQTMATGPSGGISTSTLSSKYVNLGNKKLGEGHTYVANAAASFSSAENFTLSWNCSSLASVNVYAFGYKVGDTDDGNLNGGSDIAISTTGSATANTTPDTCYTYSDTEKDSFFYAWILHSMSTDGTWTHTHQGISPERPNVTSTGLFSLQTETMESGGYPDIIAEAIFSKEYLAADNLGDINQDGIPDLFAVQEWGGGNLIELVSGATDTENEDGSSAVTDNDTLNLASSNPDEDYLPGVYSNNGTSYAPIGPNFTTKMEIRGFDEGLNATDVTTSDASFSDVEQAAWEAYATANNITDAETTQDLTVWSPEPTGTYARMDPTVEDTDGDGFSDGWEYYFWYMAHVWAPAGADRGQPRTGQTYVFERFNFDKLVEGDEITYAEVEERFNPCEDNSDLVADDPDFDNDGLSDLEEFVIGTNPCHWDTDGDHMSDAWEVMMSLDPLDSDDKDGNPDGDYMAYAYTTGVPMLLVDETAVDDEGNPTAAAVFYAFPTLVEDEDYTVGTDAAGNTTYTMLRNVKVPYVSFSPKFTITETTDDDGNAVATTNAYVYGLVGDTADYGWGTQMVAGLQTSEDLGEDDYELHTGDELGNHIYLLVHDQVRTMYGFDPRTGWYAPSSNSNYLGTRWSSSGDGAGLAVNTREYYNYDEYLVIKYRRDYAKNAEYADLPTTIYADTAVWNYIVQNATNPSIIETTTTTTDDDTTTDDEETTDTTAYEISQAVADAFDTAGSTKTSFSGHGADTDEDGVPDGWELYMNYNPSFANTSANSDRDGDNLSYVAEYAGTDSCNAYSGCSTIYANHPSQDGSVIAGWYNKFFPTDPTDGDTDGDGIDDKTEGGTWTGDFYNGGNQFSTSLTALYGSPTDDNTRCIRGGGMNPCSIDTDADGIPDGWEMQHAGVPFDASSLVPTLDDEVTISTSTLIADGLYSTSTNTASTVTNSTVYIAGGMDPTWNGDRMGTGYDSLLGVTRDVDFDQDGLQNWQEYVIQSIRHFRWDDVTTPLMGRLLTRTDEAFLYTMSYKGYVPFDSASPEDFKTAVAEAWEGTTDIPTRLEETAHHQLPWTEDGWRDLGYFAPPPHDWDRANTAFDGAVYMLPIGGWMSWVDTDVNPLGYATTDPRLSDTDGDGLDDYYELFHGLNPILGTDPDAPGDSAWDGGKKGDIVALAYRYAYAAETLETYNAYCNAWIYPTFDIDSALAGTANVYGTLASSVAYDPILYPWIMGTPLCDADGDGVRNAEESIKANVTDPAPTHTDPTPAWFTDHTKESSYTAQYYIAQASLKNSGFSWWSDSDDYGAMTGSTTDYLFAFEEGEGYDTDNDWTPDNREMTTTTTTATDPLDFTDPDRRQALYLDGQTGSFVMAAATQIRAVDASDLFKQFTVECWVRPESTGTAQTILERSCAVPASSLTSDPVAIRANFRIGLTSDGTVYGLFDNNDAIESGLNQPTSCQRVDGKVLATGEWTHVALTYDGTELILYINGEAFNSASTSLVPANGVFNIHQTSTESDQIWSYDYDYLDTSFFIGARPVAQQTDALVSILVEPETPKVNQFQEFFNGYVDEVRLWDGARTADEIASTYATRFTKDDVEELREDVYTVWRPDLTGDSGPKGTASATRNNTDGRDILPAELVCHYNFSTLPGAVETTDVAQEPIGFTANVLGAAMNDYSSKDTTGLYAADGTIKGGTNGSADGDLTIGWWEKCEMHSTVYTNLHVVPWIENTVAHLPVLDGSCVDTFLYGEAVSSGYVPAAWNSLTQYVFPNTAMPYMYTSYGADRDLHLTKLEILYTAVPDTSLMDLYARYRFYLQTMFIGTSDLVPMGGAYAKTCDEMWDGSAADAWEYTGTDSDADGLPDWWEAIAVSSYGADADTLTWDSTVTYNGASMPAYQAYLIDLALGMQPDGTTDSTYASTADEDSNSIPDWWEDLYGVKGAGLLADSDNDGLSDYVEYLLSFVFDLGQIFDPTKPYSVNGYDIDYFYPIGKLYAGAIFTDADMMEDSWEGTYDSSYVDRNTWDATSDNDADGWSAFSECRYNTFTSTIVANQISHIFNESEVKDFPVPTLKVTLRYNGSQDISTSSSSTTDSDNQEENSLAPIVIKTYTETGLQSDNVVADATFTIEPGETVDRTAYLGRWGERIARGTLTPGYVVSSSLTLETAYAAQSDSYTWTISDSALYGGTKTGTYAEYLADYNLYGATNVTLATYDTSWTTLADSSTLTVAQIGDSNDAYICLNGKQYGSLNLQTGEFSLDLESLGDYVPAGTNTTYSLTDAYFRFTYQSQVPVTQSQKLTLYLGTPNTGAVVEGKNNIVAIYDLDGDGAYTAGEPLGYAYDVDVGWSQGEIDMELTDTSPVITRMMVGSSSSDDGSSSASVTTDRNVLYGDDDGDYHDLTGGDLTGGDYQRVRIVRAMINGFSLSSLGVSYTTVADTWINLSQRPYIFEGDILTDTELDLDWSTYQSEIAAKIPAGLDPTSVVYCVVLGNGDYDLTSSSSNNLLAVGTARAFDISAARVYPTLVSPGVSGNSIVYGSRPTFTWTMGAFDTYTAFKVQVLDSTGSTVWDSGVRRAPARDADGNYVFVPDVYLGDVLESGVTYKWRCSMYNAKFRSDYWSTNVQSFVMNSSAAGYGSIDVCVKYFGPSLDYGTIRVEAFTNPDFTGDPVARASITNATDALVAEYGTNHVANATLQGLEEGEYYIRAYIDDSTYGTEYKRDDWESWGYACPRQKSANMFNPSTVSLGSNDGAGETILVYIEDVDSNGNSTPDSWEMNTNGGSLSNGVTDDTETNDGGITLNTALVENLTTNGTSTATSGLTAQIVTTLSTASVQSLILGVTVEDGSTLTETVEDATEVVDGTVAITSATFDQDAGTVTLTVEADVENAYADSLTSALYTFNTTSTDVTCVVWYKASLADAEWTEVGRETVTVGSESAEVVVDVSSIDTSAAGFYMITLE